MRREKTPINGGQGGKLTTPAVQGLVTLPVLATAVATSLLVSSEVQQPSGLCASIGTHRLCMPHPNLPISPRRLLLYIHLPFETCIADG